jgi:multidrug efflux pump subunit AcrA (membrane-fusion protein)
MTVTAEKTTTSRHGKRRRFTRRRIVVIVVIVLVLLLVAGWIWARAAARADAARPRFAAVETGSVAQTVDASGTIAAAREADLSFQVGGQVTAIPVTVGQQVSTGQVLATIDSASLPSQVAQAKATLAQNRAKRDADDDASSEQRAADDAAVNAAQAQLDSAQKQLDKATLTSTIDGTVATVNLDVGQQVAAGGGGSASSGSAASAAGGATASAAGAASAASSGSTASSAATAQIVVVSTDASIVKASVDDTQVGQLKVGQQVDITPNGATTPVQGTVSEVGMVATQTSGVASYPVTVDVAAGTTGLHIGASAQLSIVITKVDGVLTVPTAAVRQENGSSVVDEMRDSKRVSVPVTVGLTGGGRSEISSGLRAGDQVVLPGDAAGTAAQPAGGLFGGGGGAGGGAGANNGGGTRTGAGG